MFFVFVLEVLVPSFLAKLKNKFGRPRYLLCPEIRRLDKLRKVSVLGRSVFVDVLGGKFIAMGRGVPESVSRKL